MAYVPISRMDASGLAATAERGWAAIQAARPDLEPALALQRRLISLVIQVAATLEGGRLPRLSLPPKYVAASSPAGCRRSRPSPSPFRWAR
jgi:hypothetical protein